VGIGGRFRVRAMSAKSFGDYSTNVYMEDWNAWEEMSDVYAASHPADFPAAATPAQADEQYFNNMFAFFERVGLLSDGAAFDANSPVTKLTGVVKSDHITEFTGSVGVYFNLPINRHFSLGSKLLVGRSITQDLDIDGQAEGNVKNINYSLAINNGRFDLDMKDASGNVITRVDYPVNTGEKYTDEWDYLTLSASNSTSWGTGLSLTYRYKSNFSWRLFCDYDYTEKSYTLRHNPYHFLQKALTPEAYNLMWLASDIVLDPRELNKDKKMHYFTVGLSFLVNL